MGLIFAILASLCFVALDIFRKVLGSRMSASGIVIGISFGSAVMFFLFLLVNGGWEFDRVFLIVAAIEALTFTVASVLYVRAVTLSPLSLTIPYLAFTPVVSMIVALLVLHEKPSPRGVVGILIVVVGALLLHLGKDQSFKELLTAPFHEPGSWRMLLVALTWGATTSLDKIAIQHGSEALLGLFLTFGSCLLLMAGRLVGFGRDLSGGPPALDRRRLRLYALLALTSVVAGVAVLSQFFAYRELLVAYVETIKRGGGLLSVLAGIVFFGEGDFKKRVPAAAMMVIGIALIIL